MHLQPYLIFPGTCREAIHFYAETLGGAIDVIQTYGESHLEVPAEHAERVFNSVLSASGVTIRASDGEPGNDQRIGQNIALFLLCESSDEQERVFAALAEGGQVVFPLEGGFGMVEDRFEIRWMVAQNPQQA